MPADSFAALVDAVAIAAGLLLSLALWLGAHGNRRANRWLAAFTLALTLLSFGDLVADAAWDRALPQLAHLADWLIFLVGPLLWMYVRRLTMNARPTNRRWWWHAFPAVLCLALLLPFHFAPLATKQATLAAERAAPPATLDPLLALAVVQVLGYWLAAYLTLNAYGRRLRENHSALEQRRFRWLAVLLAVNFAMWLMWMLGIVLHTAWSAWFDVLAVPLGLYLLAWFGLRQPAVFVSSEDLPADLGAPESAGKYQRSGLDRSEVPALLRRLEDLMQTEKPWLENDLTLGQLAERADLSPHHLSQLLNAELKSSFFDYINERRVREVKRCLGEPAFDSQTILEIALASGFRSKAAFNAAFKQHTGITPSAYRRGVLADRPGRLPD